MKTMKQLSLLISLIALGVCKTFAQSEDKNYVKTRQLRVPVQSIQQLNNLPEQNMQTSIVYSDGLGRTTQQIAVGQSPNYWDVIQPVVYDELGRSHKQYLPYTRSNDGNYDASFETHQEMYYKTQASIAHSLYPYSETVFEASPLSRVLEQSAPGADWQLGSGHTQTVKQRLNLASEVHHWKMVNDVSVHQGTYPEATLMAEEANDEHGNTYIIYKDQAGRKCLEKRQLTANEWAETYFIYDDFGRLRYVLPPNAVKQMHTTQNYQVSSLSEEELFIYQYNKRGLPIAKKVPGADWQYLIYDDYNRPVLTQDGNLRLQGKWRFTKYDASERVILSGIYTPDATQQAMVANAQVTGLISPSSLPMYEKRMENAVGYSSNAFPNTNIDILEIFYYDDYDFDGNGIADFTYVDPPNKMKNQIEQVTVGQNPVKSHISLGITISYWNLPTAHNRGKLTGSKTRILGSDNWITSASFYSEYGRVLQTQTMHHLVEVDIADMSYRFDGLLLKSHLKHTAFGNTTEVFNRFEYDHAGRLIAGWEQHNNAALIQLSEKRYNELGQLIENNLGIQQDGTNLQSVDFAYNIRGWMTHINNADLSNDIDISVGDEYVERLTSIELTKIMVTAQSVKDQNGIKKTTITVKDERKNTYTDKLNNERQAVNSSKTKSSITQSFSNTAKINELESLQETLEISLDTLEFSEGTSLEEAFDQIEGVVVEALSEQGIIGIKAVEEVVKSVERHLKSIVGNVYFNDDNHDLFGMELNYNRTQSDGLNPTAQYNGNISQMLWQSKGDEIKRAYDFTYDASNRLTSATYHEYDKAAETWNVNVGKYSVPTISYDANGNILSLERNGYLSNTTFGTIDQLTYSYDQNRLKAVEDVVTTGGYADFKNGITATTEYTYDANGNMTSDLNKGITVQYNVLNLPELITFNDGSTIAYAYAANAQKLTATFTNAQENSSYSREYVGGFIYNDNQLEMFSTAEGRAIPDASTGGFLLEYHYRDHLGNTRLTFSDRDGSGDIDVATEVLQQEHYYPYGMTFEGTGAPVIDGKHPFLYTNKEMYDQFDLHWMDFGARFYDPALARWHAVDPLADKYHTYSPYNMVIGNPLSLIDPDGRAPGPGDNIAIGTVYVYNVWWENGNKQKRLSHTYESDKTNGHNSRQYRYFDSKGEVYKVANQDLGSSGKYRTKTGESKKRIIGGEDYSGLIQNAKQTDYDRNWGTAFWKDVTADLWNVFYKPVVDGGRTIADPDASVPDKIEAGITIITTLPSGAKSSAAKTSTNVLSKGELLRIENAATRINKPITVVGSRAKGTAGTYSDWDYVIEGLNSRNWSKIKNSLPGSRSILDNTPRNIDIFKGPVNSNLPHITIYPR